MKVSALFLCAAAASASPWWPFGSSDKAPAGPPNGMEYDLPFLPAPTVNLTKCVKRCINKNWKDAGCGHAEDWACLCRPGPKGLNLAFEVEACTRAKCKEQADAIVQRRIKLVRCKYHPRPPEGKPNEEEEEAHYEDID